MYISVLSGSRQPGPTPSENKSPRFQLRGHRVLELKSLAGMLDTRVIVEAVGIVGLVPAVHANVPQPERGAAQQPNSDNPTSSDPDFRPRMLGWPAHLL
jgi:hypothetical protein